MFRRIKFSGILENRVTLTPRTTRMRSDPLEKSDLLYVVIFHIHLKNKLSII